MITIADQLDELYESLAFGRSHRVVFAQLEALQAAGLSQLDLTVHLERWRAVNEHDGYDEAFDDRLLDALDMVSGFAGAMRLHWPARAVAYA